MRDSCENTQESTQNLRENTGDSRENMRAVVAEPYHETNLYSSYDSHDLPWDLLWKDREIGLCYIFHEHLEQGNHSFA